ncbi:DUF6680 family protein [Maridesulfovibrio salexigens]|uniref:DUF6680 domain-containing protein n=1 Tax=Maridesulfovibrio salexigens (strain ATCC 14822 / DSM 2638 / NCIMB 8403 / VKM B-1763) TaxID=526222 RepID=C6C062_MARSD|nr:DUF6680 family protein [Maridesulfovibrio salexigens]ACS80933.1 conserved hypothetical protein [Maridesulfovibrio salexigens DSM 2638]
MSLNEVLTLIAILLGPIFAVIVGQYLQDRKSKKERREQVFKDLMSTRKLGIHLDHVKALNLIDFEFASNSSGDRAVRSAWSLYLKHLEDHAYRLKDAEEWNRKTEHLLYDLIETLAKCLNFSVQRSQIERGGYAPQFYNNVDTENQILRQSLINLATGRSCLKVVAIESEKVESKE